MGAVVRDGVAVDRAVVQVDVKEHEVEALLLPELSRCSSGPPFLPWVKLSVQRVRLQLYPVAKASAISMGVSPS